MPLASRLRRWKAALVIVQPDTLLRWHRELFRWIWKRRSRARRKRGRRSLTGEVVGLFKRIAKENRRWGAERIRGELLKLGVRVSKSTIQKYMREVREHRGSQQTWATFLRNHASEIWACDFLQTYDILLRTVFVFIIIELGSRRVVHFGVTRNPSEQWVAQQLREATPFGERPRFVIRDNDSKYVLRSHAWLVGQGLRCCAHRIERQGQTRYVSASWAACDENASTTS